jgi:hypothetical protein
MRKAGPIISTGSLWLRVGATRGRTPGTAEGVRSDWLGALDIAALHSAAPRGKLRSLSTSLF